MIIPKIRNWSTRHQKYSSLWCKIIFFYHTCHFHIWSLQLHPLPPHPPTITGKGSVSSTQPEEESTMTTTRGGTPQHWGQATQQVAQTCGKSWCRGCWKGGCPRGGCRTCWESMCCRSCSCCWEVSCGKVNCCSCCCCCWGSIANCCCCCCWRDSVLTWAWVELSCWSDWEPATWGKAVFVNNYLFHTPCLSNVSKRTREMFSHACTYPSFWKGDHHSEQHLFGKLDPLM